MEIIKKRNFFLFVFITLIVQGCYHSDSIYISLGKDFYQDTSGQMFMLTSSLEFDKSSLWKPSASNNFVLSEPFYVPVPNIIDVESFESLRHGFYSKDENHVYIESLISNGSPASILEEADPATFEAFGFQWGKDKQHVYHNGTILQELNPDSLVILDTLDKENYALGIFSWIRDHQFLFHDATKIDSVDIPSLEILWDSVYQLSYFQDKDWIYEHVERKTKRKF